MFDLVRCDGLLTCSLLAFRTRYRSRSSLRLRSYGGRWVGSGSWVRLPWCETSCLWLVWPGRWCRLCSFLPVLLLLLGGVFRKSPSIFLSLFHFFCWIDEVRALGQLLTRLGVLRLCDLRGRPGRGRYRWLRVGRGWWCDVVLMYVVPRPWPESSVFWWGPSIFSFGGWGRRVGCCRVWVSSCGVSCRRCVGPSFVSCAFVGEGCFVVGHTARVCEWCLGP